MVTDLDEYIHEFRNYKSIQDAMLEQNDWEIVEQIIWLFPEQLQLQ